MPSFYPDPETIFPFLFLWIYLTKMGRKRKFGNAFFLVLVWVFFSNHKTELFEEKESLTTLNVNAPILCIQFTELNYAAY